MSLYSLFDNHKTFVLGHRGYSEKFPENTMESFAACASDKRIDGIELDVHLCKSGEVVVAHDGNLKRTAGIDRYIEDMDWEELSTIDVGSFKSGEFSSCRMPLLKDLFESFGNRFAYDIELKVEKGRKYKKLCKYVWDLICTYNLEENVMVSSFNPKALRYFNKICMMSVPTADIYCEDSNIPYILRHGWGHHISQSSYSKPSFEQVNEEFVKKLNLEVIAWTVNSPEVAEKLLKTPGCKGLIGNNPVLLADIREKIK